MDRRSGTLPAVEAILFHQEGRALANLAKLDSSRKFSLRSSTLSHFVQTLRLIDDKSPPEPLMTVEKLITFVYFSAAVKYYDFHYAL